jgi:hypothetical protein
MIFGVVAFLCVSDGGLDIAANLVLASLMGGIEIQSIGRNNQPKQIVWPTMISP